ncbi:protein kinase [Lotmaria passim]
MNAATHVKAPQATSAADDSSCTFCVVCGSMRGDLVLRKSGLKCPSCIGKSASKRLCKLLAKRKSQKTSRLNSSAPKTTVEETSSAPPGDCISPVPMLSSSLSSSVLPSNDDTSGALDGTRRPIEEYISGTSVFRAAVQFARHGRRIHDSDSAAGDAEVGEAARLSSAAASKRNTDSPTSPSLNGTTAAQPPAVPRTRGAPSDPPASATSTGGGDDAAGAGRGAASALERPPPRLPPRHAPRSPVEHAAPIATSLPPFSGRCSDTGAKSDAFSAANVANEAAAAAPTATPAAVSHAPVTVRCAEDDDALSDGFDSSFRGEQLPALEAASDPYALHPYTPRDDASSSVASAVQSTRPRAYHTTTTLSSVCSRRPRHTSPSPSTKLDTNANPLAPRAGSRAGSSSSSLMERCSSSSRPPVCRVHACSSSSPATDTHLHTASPFTQVSTVAALTAPPAPASDRSSALGKGSVSCSATASLCRLPRRVNGGGADDVASMKSTPAHDAQEGGDTAPSSSSVSSSSLTSSVTSATSSPLTSPSAAAAATQEILQPTTAGCDDHGGVVPASPVVRNLDAVHFTVELVLPPFREEAAATTTESATERSATSSIRSSSSASRSDSTAPGHHPKDEYRRQVGTGGVFGSFTVIRHLRRRSSGDASGGVGAPDPGTRCRRRKGADSAAMGGQLEVKKLTFRIVVRDRESGVALIAQERRLYSQIIPALEKVKLVARAGLPRCPNRRLPSLRFATDAFIEERRAEVEAFLQAVERSPFLVRHPDVLGLLGLEASGAGGGAVASAVDIGAGAMGRKGGAADSISTNGSNTSTGTERRRASSADPRRRGVSAALVKGAAQGDRHGSPVGGDKASCHGDARAVETAAAGAHPGYLNSEALNAYRHPAVDSDTGAPPYLFCRTPSQSSVRTSRSSVVRRRTMDEVTMEDLERIQLGNLIGRGTFGSVYLGLLQTRRGPLIVAVKVMTVGEEVPPGELAGLQRELDVLCAARHKNIIRFLGSSLDTATRELRVFTEYVECGTIHSLVERFGALTLLSIQQYMRQILHGLQYLHSLSIAHRDIKGDNILVTKNGRVKLSDFGSSTGVPQDATAAAVRAAGEGAAGDNDGCGTGADAAGADLPIGSPPYMAPEVIQGTVRSALAADIWSLGCVGIEMLARPIWDEKPHMNPFVFLFRVSRAGTPPQGLPTAAELTALERDGRGDEAAQFAVYRDFLLACCNVDPAQRPTAAELLKHPFLTQPYAKHLRWMPPPPSPSQQGASPQVQHRPL